MIAIQNKSDKFYNYFALALVVHTVVFTFFYISPTFDFFKDTRPKINIIKSSVRVDIVAMPKFTQQELKEMKLVPMSDAKEIKENIKEKKENIIKEKLEQATKKVNLSSLFGDLSKKKIVESDKNTTGKKNTVKYNKELAKLVLEGNKISKGTAVTGTNDYSNSEAFTSYVQELPSYVRPFWKLPTYLIDKDIRCRIKVFISKSGEVLNFRIFESSGDSEFDQRAINAIKMVKKFPPPKGEIALRAASGEIILGFPL